jgi:hypothetical protein
MKPEQRLNYEKLNSWLERQERQYNPEKDLLEVVVTSTDMALLQTCKELLKEVKYLRKQQDAITSMLYSQTGVHLSEYLQS